MSWILILALFGGMVVCGGILAGIACIKRHDIRNKLLILTLLAGIAMVIGSFVLFIIAICGVVVSIMITIAVPLLVNGALVIVASIIIKKHKHLKKDSMEECVYFSAKGHNVVINPDKRTLKFGEALINIDDIVSYELADDSKIIVKSGFGEAVVGGLLFGSVGAAAGAYAGKREKFKENGKFFIKTKNVRYAGIVINMKLDDGYRLFETLELMTKDQKEEKEKTYK